ncbi:MAG: hypothetical protein IPJ74_02100 [Saprospiraceae bacterium]|nr:hypothetical protein [Saprospiraceae bacterium]
MEKEKIFWDWFREHEKAFHYYNEIPDSPQKDEITIALGRKLHEYCDHLYFAFMQNFYDPDKEHFIITTNGNQDYFKQVFKLVEYAPRDLSRWFFEALLPPAKRYTDHYTVDYEGIILDPKEIWFRQLVNSASPLLFGVMLFFKDYDIYHDHEDIGGAVERLLITELGELSISLNVHYLDISPLPPDPEESGCMPFHDLAEVLERHLDQKVKLTRN